MNIDAIRVIICILIYISKHIPLVSLLGPGEQPMVTHGIYLPHFALFLMTLILLQSAGQLFPRIFFTWGLSDVSTSQLGLDCAFSARMLQKCLCCSGHPWGQPTRLRWRHHALHCEVMTAPLHLRVQWEEPWSIHTCSMCVFVRASALSQALVFSLSRHSLASMW